MSFNYEVRTTHWSEFKAIRATVQEIAEEVRRDYRRKSRHTVSIIAHRPIKSIISPLSLLFNHRYSDEATVGLIEAAVNHLNMLASEIERSYQDRYVKELRELAQRLVNFLSEYEGVQLELFDGDQYRQGFYMPLVAACFKQWLRGLNWDDIREVARVRAEKLRKALTCVYQPLISGFVCQMSPS